ncbi:hypothetical protein EF888_02475 [Silicimonas algicola]|uniref:Uncharacterized protein n=1 Tax=Silicimonas algicola TaxID=1826607 RepID=A0A316GG71_9RHOB|nr:DUF6544 family protein [Silicimonas algicola]AZQ66089.1 hypothetical protein EF888_02475 [Silicimonas algicola]PWK58390.1 hypothetical protein C8D95_101203 [Silicimonas algicola]
MILIEIAVASLLLLLVALIVWRVSDVLRASAAWRRLASLADPAPRFFDPAMIADLPEPARRYFAYSMTPGAPLARVVELTMEGDLCLGDARDPKSQPIGARQILVAPEGFVWRVGGKLISGSDGALPETSWTRFWVAHLLPVARLSGTPDHRRSAFGRVVAEAAIWSPATLLPSKSVTWDATGPDTARATVSFAGLIQSVSIDVDDDGAPLRVTIDRWSDANPDHKYRLQPFGGTLSDHRDFGGYRLATRVEGGNHIGTPEYFPFYRVRITAVTLR